MYNLVKWSMEFVQDADDKEKVKGFILNNNYHANPESILLSMLADDDSSIRTKAVALIKKARAETNPGDIRSFRKPNKDEMNWSASHFTELVNWNNLRQKVTECPATFKLSEDELDSIASGTTKFRLKGIYCHTQSCERAVGQVTLASQSVVSCSLNLLKLCPFSKMI